MSGPILMDIGRHCVVRTCANAVEVWAKVFCESGLTVKRYHVFAHRPDLFYGKFRISFPTSFHIK